jgi:hypothetical protein
LSGYRVGLSGYRGSLSACRIGLFDWKKFLKTFWSFCSWGLDCYAYWCLLSLTAIVLAILWPPDLIGKESPDSYEEMTG